MNDRTRDDDDLNQLSYPALAFGRPSEVVNNPDLTLNEKRAILASWASDAWAVDAAGGLQSNSGGAPVRFDEAEEALRTLDKQVNRHRYRRVPHRRSVLRRDTPNARMAAAP